MFTQNVGLRNVMSRVTRTDFGMGGGPFLSPPSLGGTHGWGGKGQMGGGLDKNGYLVLTLTKNRLFYSFLFYFGGGGPTRTAILKGIFSI